jgi:hypothetical protein
MRRRRRSRLRTAKSDFVWISATVTVSPISRHDILLLREKSYSYGATDTDSVAVMPDEYEFKAYFEDCRRAEQFEEWVRDNFG